MSHGSRTAAPAAPGGFWMRAGLLASVVGMMLVIWASHVYLTRAFSEDQSADATVRATLYAGAIQSTMQRNSVIPLLLSRDPILILALRSGEYEGAEERLASFREEIGAGSIFLLDADGPDRRGQRRAAARAVRRRQGATSREARGRHRHGLLDHRERRRRRTASTTRAG